MLDQIISGLHHPFQSSRNWLRCLHEELSVWLSHQSDYKSIIRVHVNEAIGIKAYSFTCVRAARCLAVLLESALLTAQSEVLLF